MTQMQRKYPQGHREAAVEMVFEAREPEESMKSVCERLAPVLDVKFATLYNWSKRATPTSSVSTRKAPTVADIEDEVKALRKELREVKRANEILKAAATFFGAEIDRQSQR